MILRIHPDNPDERRIRQAVQILEKDGVLVVPTDTVYSFACALGSARGLERVARLKGINPKEAKFSIACADLSQLSNYSRPLDNALFKMMKRTLPGPYTFIVPANNNVPKWFAGKRKHIGIRVPNNNVLQALVRELGKPLVVSSVRDEDEVIEYTTDPTLIAERFENQIDGIIDSGYGTIDASTVVDCTDETPKILREGIGPSPLP
ncbi:MAG: L-threonylcarbamoyladenylate synthase [Bacteroidetes bacterium]|nr:L-threonylcarbamoyladenylate synthase [Bacteroidota bacterium]MDA1336284.1 L-threonylcarbamoyladenylate synthase [Bacteroidota bacterium]